MLPGNRNNVHWWLFTGIRRGRLGRPGVSRRPDLTEPDGTGRDHGDRGERLLLRSSRSASGWAGASAGHGSSSPSSQGRFGFDMNGSYFTQNNAYANPDGDGGPRHDPPDDVESTAVGSMPNRERRFAVLLTVGIGLDQ